MRISVLLLILSLIISNFNLPRPSGGVYEKTTHFSPTICKNLRHPSIGLEVKTIPPTKKVLIDLAEQEAYLENTGRS